MLEQVPREQKGPRLGIPRCINVIGGYLGIQLRINFAGCSATSCRRAVLALFRMHVFACFLLLHLAHGGCRRSLSSDALPWPRRHLSVDCRGQELKLCLQTDRQWLKWHRSRTTQQIACWA